MSIDDSERLSRFDPRYSSAFQRGGSYRESDPVVTGAPTVPAWSSAGLAELEEAMREPSAAVEDQAPPVVAASRAPSRQAIRYVVAWGWSLTLLSVALLVFAVWLQQQAYGPGAVVNSVQWLFPVSSVLTMALPYLLVLGLSLLVFGGYQSRVHLRGNEDDG